MIIISINPVSRACNKFGTNFYTGFSLSQMLSIVLVYEYTCTMPTYNTEYFMHKMNDKLKDFCISKKKQGKEY